MKNQLSDYEASVQSLKEELDTLREKYSEATAEVIHNELRSPFSWNAKTTIGLSCFV